MHGWLHLCVILAASTLALPAAPSMNPKAAKLINQGETHLGEYRLKQVEAALRDALKELEINPGKDVQKVRAYIFLAAVQRENCQFTESFKAAREAIGLAQALKPKARRTQLMYAHWELGLIHHLRAEYPEAIDEFDKAIACVAQPQEETNLPLLMAEATAAYIDCGRYTEAKTLLDRARKLIPLYAPVDREELTAELDNHYRNYLLSLGQYKEAEQSIQRSVDWFTENFGRRHLRTAVPLANLALVFQETGAYARAERIFKLNLQISRHTVGDKHLFTSIDMANLAGALLDAGRLEEAIGLY